MGIKGMALLIGVPITWEEFETRAPVSDWLSKFWAPNMGDEERTALLRRGWERQYNPSTARPYSDLAKDCAARGAFVRTRATVGDLGEATRRFEIVVVLGHWKGPEVASGDLVQPVDAGALMARAREGQGPLAEWLACRFGQELPGAPGRTRPWWRSVLGRNGDKRTIPEILNGSLDAVIEGELALPAGIDAVTEADITRRTRRRGALDMLLAGLVKPGNRLELFDGLHDIAAVNQAVASDFKGILDLVACTSTPLADRISATRGYAPRVVQFEDPIQPLLAAFYLGAAIRLLADGHPYSTARELGRAVIDRELSSKLVQSPPRKRSWWPCSR